MQVKNVNSGPDNPRKKITQNRHGELIHNTRQQVRR